MAHEVTAAEVTPVSPTNHHFALDTIISLEEDSVDIPVGEQTLVVYYRTCGGWCSHLDGPQDFCVVEAAIIEGARYDLAVTSSIRLVRNAR